MNYAQLLEIPKETIEENVQYLHSIGMDYNNGFLLGTRPQTKRKKLAWLLREVFDYRNIPQDQKMEAINRLYSFVRENPKNLIRSIATLNRNKDKLREKAKEY